MAIEWKRGEEVPEWRAAQVPDLHPLVGRFVRLEPIDSARHAAALFDAQATGDPHLWDYMPSGPYETQYDMAYWLGKIAPSRDPLFYAVIDQATVQAAGMVSYLSIVPEHGSIEIGYIWFGSTLQKTPGATEAIYLLARHAFDDLGYRRFEWKCDSLNQRSRRAAERFGFSYEGIFRQHRVNKGRNRDTAWFAMIDKEWPVIKAAFEAWLSPDNFDVAGQQRQSLSELREAMHGE